jgi:RNA polymerase sigma factor (sigma-70 family)
MATGPFKQVLHHLRTLVEGRLADPADDAALLWRFADNGDEAAFEKLVQRHGAMVRNVCQGVLRNAADADDAFQATFLVLARKAGSFRRGGSLASWLYGIAYRTARKAQTLSARRRSHERSAMHETVAADPAEAAARQELRPLVHEALNQLPERFRGPLVLCYLENKTVAEAAQILGRPFGSMSWLLERGRQLLRERLERRGVALSLSGLTAVLAAEGSAAALPASMATAAAQAALGFAGRSTLPAGAATALAQSLAEGVLHDMFKRKIKHLTVVLLALVLFSSGAGLIGYQFRGAGVAVAVPADDTKPELEKAKTEPLAYPLQLKLVAKKDTYTLDLGGKTPEQFRKDIEKIVQDAVDKKLPAEQMQDIRRLLPPAPAVDLVLEVTNMGKEEETIEVQPSFQLTLRGPGAPAPKTGDQPVTTIVPPPSPAKQGPLEVAPTASLESRGDGAISVTVNTFRTLRLLVRPIKLTLKPGETQALAVSIATLNYGSTFTPNRGGFAYWTKAGEYTLTASMSAAVKPAPKGAMPYGDQKDYGMLSLTSKPIRLRVVDAKARGNTDPPAAP